MTNEAEIVEGEFVERAVARVETRSAFGTDNPIAIVERVSAVSTPLADFIKARGMTTRISGREYVMVEGWSFMGAMLGVSPIATSVCELRSADGDLVGFEAHVELRMRDGSLVGGAVAECSRSEKSWRDRDDFALKSMAQTRATGKAYRLAFGFVMKAAGYEATPAEEMPDEPEPRHVSGERAIRAVQPPRPRNAPTRPVEASEGTPERLCPLHPTELLSKSARTGAWGHVVDGVACVPEEAQG